MRDVRMLSRQETGVLLYEMECFEKIIQWRERLQKLKCLKKRRFSDDLSAAKNSVMEGEWKDGNDKDKQLAIDFQRRAETQQQMEQERKWRATECWLGNTFTVFFTGSVSTEFIIKVMGNYHFLKGSVDNNTRHLNLLDS